MVCSGFEHGTAGWMLQTNPPGQFVRDEMSALFVYCYLRSVDVARSHLFEEKYGKVKKVLVPTVRLQNV